MNKIKRGLIVFIAFFIYQVVLLLPLAFFHIDITKLSLLTKTMYLLGCDFLFIIFIVSFYYKELKEDLKDFKLNFKNYLDDDFKYWVIGLVLMTVTNILISLFTPIKVASNEEAVRSLLTKAPIYMMFGTCLFAPITEELIFRKAFRDLFETKWLYLIMSGLIFGSLHVIYSFTSFYELLYIFPYGALGFMFAYLYSKTNNIINPIIMHTIHNTILVLLFLFTK
jgi:membrane protease YdiL (CAAX protease family)